LHEYDSFGFGLGQEPSTTIERQFDDATDEIPPGAILWMHRDNIGPDDDPKQRNWMEWMAATFPPEVCQNFVLLPVYRANDLTTGRGMARIVASGGWQSTLGCFRFATNSEAIMNSILSMALVLGSYGLAGPADDKAVDPVGTWKCEYEIGGQQRTSTLQIKKDGDTLTGTMTWPDQDETKLKDLKLTDATLTFSAVRKLPGMDDGITVEYKLKIEGAQIKGKGSAEFGGEKQEWDIEAKKQ
jgi:hypothetical protein